jgi:purine-nucleoside phosphorylase
VSSENVVGEIESAEQMQQAVAAMSLLFLNKECDRPRIGIVLGSGLAESAVQLFDTVTCRIPWSSIPGMPIPSVSGHAGLLISGRIAHTPTVALVGRVHRYECDDEHHVAASDLILTFGIRLLMRLGIQKLILTNAAGGIRPGMRPGDLMLIEDHLMLPMPPFRTADSRERIRKTYPGKTHSAGEPALSADQSSPESSALGVRSRSLAFQSALWCQHMVSTAMRIDAPLQIHRGVYAMMSGPCYETPAEVRMLRALGVDAAGMSTVPEALCAASAGVSVLGVSCITNLAAGLSTQQLSHREVIETAERIRLPFTAWLKQVIHGLDSVTN